MSILHLSLPIPPSRRCIPPSISLSTGPFPPQTLFSISTRNPFNPTFKTTPIRMGGGPRTYPGGVSKWQWKRMQAKKAKQLLKARLARERQIYEMRKRAELKAAVSELERPWETVERPPNLFSVGADEQLKVLADRFQQPGGLDLWSERDGPEIFRPDNGVPSARFFPKGVVHSVRPYGKIGDLGRDSEELENWDLDRSGESDGIDHEIGIRRNGYPKNSSSSRRSEGVVDGKMRGNKPRKTKRVVRFNSGEDGDARKLGF